MQKMVQEATLPLAKQLDETVRLLASKDAIAYSEISYVKQREAQIAAYEGATRYYSGDALAAEEARISGEMSEEIELDKEDLDAIIAVMG
jgi:hypothetical protein